MIRQVLLARKSRNVKTLVCVPNVISYRSNLEEHILTLDPPTHIPVEILKLSFEVDNRRVVELRR